MRTLKENAQHELGVGNTKGINCTNIFTHLFNSVKQNVKRILRSFRNYGMSSATLLHSQNICDPDGVKVHIALEGSTVFMTDKEGNIVKFSAYLVPELRSTLLDVEKEFGRRFSHAKI